MHFFFVVNNCFSNETCQGHFCDPKHHKINFVKKAIEIHKNVSFACCGQITQPPPPPPPLPQPDYGYKSE